MTRTGRSNRAFCSTDLMLANMAVHVARLIRLAAIPPMPPTPPPLPPPPTQPLVRVENVPVFSLDALIFDLIVSNSSSTFLCGPRSH